MKCGHVRVVKCTYCSRPASTLCTFALPTADTMPNLCDKPLCGQCARNVGLGETHCRVHELRGDKGGSCLI